MREGSSVLKLSPKAMLQINLVLGGFVALTNGSALMLTLSGGRSHLAGQLGEVALWTAAGLILFALSLVGIRKQESTAILEAQVMVVFALIGALAAWGLAVATGAYRLEGAFGWSTGFLSILGIYCYVLYSNVTAIRGWAKSLRPFAIMFVVACIAIDVAAFVRVMKS
jgi:hypothetical protein